MVSLQRPFCPECDMQMIVIGGFDRPYEHKTYECLRCGHMENPVDSSGKPVRNSAIDRVVVGRTK